MRKLLFILLMATAGLQAQTILTPDDIHGPRTKWAIYPDITGGASRHSIIPQLSDLSVADFVKYLEQTGANTATLNLENSMDMLSTPKYDLFTLTPQQINQTDYTSGQANILLTNFLIDVQNAIDSGLINGNIRFHIHMRLYLNKDPKREAVFINDFSNFINLAKARGVDHLIAGIKLGEHGTNGTKYLLESALKVAQAINTNTNGWLKNYGGLEWSGDGYGRDFSKINSWGTLSSTFFAEISKYTGYFTFCYKAFDNGGELTAAGLDKNAEADWETFIRKNLGFDELKTMIQAAHAQYPNHANVIFIGDSGDAMKLIGNNEYNVTTRLYTAAGAGFRGITAINGYRRYDKGTEDNYLYFWDAISAKPPVLKPKSVARWEAWPLNDATASQYITVFGLAGIGGKAHPGGPALVKKGTDTTIYIKPSSGFEIANVTVNGLSQGPISQYKVTSANNDVRIQASFKKLDGKVFTHPCDPQIFGAWQDELSGEVWHFNNKYTVYKSNAITNPGTFYTVYWYDYPDTGTTATDFGTGEVIEMNNDIPGKAIKLAFSNAAGSRMRVDDGTGVLRTFVRDVTATKTNENNNFRILKTSQAGVFSIRANNDYNVTVYNLRGQPIAYTTGAVLDLSVQPKGLYIAVIRDLNGHIKTQKLNR